MRAIQAALVDAVRSGRLAEERLAEAAEAVEPRCADRPRGDRADADEARHGRLLAAARGPSVTRRGRLPRPARAPRSCSVDTGRQHRDRRRPLGAAGRRRRRRPASTALPAGARWSLQVRDAHRQPDVQATLAARSGRRPVVVEWGWPGRRTDDLPTGSAPAAGLAPGAVAVTDLLREAGWDARDRARSASTSARPRPSACVVDDDGHDPRPGPRGRPSPAPTASSAPRRGSSSAPRATGRELTGAVGVGMPGLVDVERGAVKHAVNLGVDGDWLPLRRPARRRGSACPVVVENDVNAATLGAVALSGDRRPRLPQHRHRPGRRAGARRPAAARRHGAAGEIGHVPVDPPGALCQCGQRGCLETVASGSALAAAWPSRRRPPAQALFAAAAAGDLAAIAVRDRFAAGVASAVRLLGLTVDPRDRRARRRRRPAGRAAA